MRIWGVVVATVLACKKNAEKPPVSPPIDADTILDQEAIGPSDRRIDRDN
jgi:hypothetical protein